MYNYIIGGGLIALLAKDILGHEWDIIPYGPSRYYSFNPAIADDYILVSEKTDPAILGTAASIKHIRAFSLAGKLIFAPNQWLYDMYTSKVYGYKDNLFSLANPIEGSRSVMSASSLYKSLLAKYMLLLTNNMAKYGEVAHITPDYIKTSTNRELHYGKILSTVPLPVLYKALGINDELESRDVWAYNVKTDQIDLEGADEVYVVDDALPFYKVNQIGEREYIFWSLAKIDTPNTFFGAFTNNKCEVNNPAGTLNKAYIALNGVKVPHKISGYNIECVGSHAQWDDSADIGTCIVRLMSKRN